MLSMCILKCWTLFLNIGLIEGKIYFILLRIIFKYLNMRSHKYLICLDIALVVVYKSQTQELLRQYTR